MALGIVHWFLGCLVFGCECDLQLVYRIGVVWVLRMLWGFMMLSLIMAVRTVSESNRLVRSAYGLHECSHVCVVETRLSSCVVRWTDGLAVR